MAEDYYKILGVSKTASIDEIKRAYRELAMKYHPDRNKSKDAEEIFKKVNEAYAVLSDPQKRQQYDTLGSDQFNRYYSPEDIFKNFDFESVFKNMGINFDFGDNPFFQDMFGGGGGGFGQSRESDAVNIQLTFDEINKGASKEYEVQHYEVCPNCKGSGGEPGSKVVKCSVCNGTGRRHVQQNTIFGRFNAITTCERCGGRGKVYENVCRTCRGRGRIIVKDRFTVRVEKKK